ncbi:protein BIG GRAIN 1-like A [Gastrolobium bilobum]|uniref:protein BIG GRAIN 1-like A n=1 Tax=Gastrolobium bilobum TaxID=150636 RepID=UPI002AAF571E|nr:protein BIG GRAIN 1-like A [Gastrolobium bilobum]
MHRRERSMREGSCPQRRRTPSFSSTLLDTIYRSIDESKTDLDEDQQLGLYNQTTHTSQHSYLNHNHGVYSEKGGKKRMNLRRAVMIEDWMEKQSSNSSQFFNSSSSSSECSSGGVFSSSETDSTFKKQVSRPKIERPQKHMNKDHRNSEKQEQQKPQREGGFTRNKLRALKIYGELNQKVKQPISPGSRIASFLSSIFSYENVKKAKMCYVGAVEDVSFEHKSKSPCFSSSASSFSRRSCMSKTPSSDKKKSTNGVKRSVRFYPVSIILGEDSEQPSCYKYIYESEPSLLPLSSSVRKITRNSSIKELKNTVLVKENGAEAAARDFIKGYRNSGKGEFDFRGFYEDDEDDALSYSSSDLFELDHLIGAARYQEELPVYETTNLETNKAIAKGLHL